MAWFCTLAFCTNLLIEMNRSLLYNLYPERVYLCFSPGCLDLRLASFGAWVSLSLFSSVRSTLLAISSPNLICFCRPSGSVMRLLTRLWLEKSSGFRITISFACVFCLVRISLRFLNFWIYSSTNRLVSSNSFNNSLWRFPALASFDVLCVIEYKVLFIGIRPWELLEWLNIFEGECE